MEFLYLLLSEPAKSVNINIFDVILKITIAIIGAVLGVIVTHIFYKSKLRKEQKVRFDGMIGERVANALLKIRDVEQIALLIDLYELNDIIDKHNDKFDFLNEGTKYLSIFNNWNSYNEFMNQIVDVRRNFEKDVDCETSLYLLFIERYLMQLGMYMKGFNDECLLPTLGTIFSYDIQKWQREFDKILIKKINSHACKLEPHYGKKWNKKREKIVERNWNNTILQALINGTSTNKKIIKALPVIKDCIEEIHTNPEKFVCG